MEKSKIMDIKLNFIFYKKDNITNEEFKQIKKIWKTGKQ